MRSSPIGTLVWTINYFHGKEVIASYRNNMSRVAQGKEHIKNVLSIALAHRGNIHTSFPSHPTLQMSRSKPKSTSLGVGTIFRMICTRLIGKVEYKVIVLQFRTANVGASGGRFDLKIWKMCFTFSIAWSGVSPCKKTSMSDLSHQAGVDVFS